MRVGCFVADDALYCLIVWLFDCLIDGRAASGSICKAGGPRSRVAACSRLPTAHLVGSRAPRDRVNVVNSGRIAPYQWTFGKFRRPILKTSWPVAKNPSDFAANGVYPLPSKGYTPFAQRGLPLDEIILGILEISRGVSEKPL